MDVWGSRDTSDVKRILLGGSYAGVVAAGAVASAQLWLHAFTVDERSATSASLRDLCVRIVRLRPTGSGASTPHPSRCASHLLPQGEKETFCARGRDA